MIGSLEIKGTVQESMHSSFLSAIDSSAPMKALKAGWVSTAVVMNKGWRKFVGITPVYDAIL